MTPEDTRFNEIILASIADGVFTVDRDWRITSFNSAAERITRVPAEEAIGCRCSDVFRADICEKRCALKKAMETQKNLTDIPARIVDSRGFVVPISISAAVLRGPDHSILGAVETFRDLSTLAELRKEIQHKYTFEDMVGQSQGLQRIFAMLPDVAESDTTVLIEGTSGSGKELLARAVHNLSYRREKPFVAVNCGALPETLFESELFGYTKGAFTDATQDKPGRLALAEGGTVFFDEVNELPPAIQVKLLRVLQEREYEPLGSVKTVKANIRIVAATNQPLAELVGEGRFRDDLFFRIAVVRMVMPPLRDRREDIPLLVEYFIRRFNARRGKNLEGVTPAVMEILMRHDFPGNVRELENLIEHGFVLCHEGSIDVRHLPEDFRSKGTSPVRTGAGGSTLMRAEADAIRNALRRTVGQLSQTAEELGISRTTLWRKMSKYGISGQEFRAT